jgi:hypothetical protein
MAWMPTRLELALVPLAVWPLENSETAALILDPAAIVEVVLLPGDFALAVALVVLELPGVGCARRPSVQPLALTAVVHPASYVNFAVWPRVLSLAVFLALFQLARKDSLRNSN